MNLWPWSSKKQSIQPVEVVDELASLTDKLILGVKQVGKPPFDPGWYQTAKQVWVRLTPFCVYLGLGRVMWCVTVENSRGMAQGCLAASMIQKQIERGLLVLRTAEDVEATHISELGKCQACGLSHNFRSRFPCNAKSKS